MIEFMWQILLLVMGFGVFTGVVVVRRGGWENSLIGLNVATICSVTILALMQRYQMIDFSTDIAFFLIFPGVFGIIIFTRFAMGVSDD